MFLVTDTIIQNLIIHNVGNQQKGDSIILGNSSIPINSELEEILKRSLLSPFKSNELFTFDSPLDNPACVSISNIFDSPGAFISESKKLAKLLYENANNPKMNGGNIFFVYFKDFIFDDILCDGIGIFKTEISDVYLKLKTKDDKTILERDSGINLKNLTKGAIIFNIEQDKGYFVSIVDKKPKGEEISY
jgi:hypothetical protein